MYHQYQRIIAITEETKSKLVEYLPSTNGKTRVVLNGIDFKKYTQAVPMDKRDLSNEIKNDEILIVMVAAFRDQKDHETLIRASKHLPSNYRVVFIGDGDRFEDVKQYAEKYGRETILFLGKRLDIPSILKTADVFVLSSKWEGFGLVVVEAATCGIPVVASDVEGLSNIVKNIGGQVFQPYNEKELAEKIIVSANKGYEPPLTLMEYSIVKTVEDYLNLYEEVKDKW